MNHDPIRANDPGSGRHLVIAARKFRYIEQDPAHELRTVWIAHDVVCPACLADTNLTLTFHEAVDPSVQVTCPTGHTWGEMAIDVGHFTAYTRLVSWCDPDPDTRWITDAGFGEEPPPPIDYAGDLKAGYTYAAKFASRRAKTRTRAAIRRPVKKAKKRAINVTCAPLAAALRTAWTWQAGGIPQDPPPPAPKQPAKEQGPKVPSYAKYRKAYGIPAPQRGPRCLVCNDSRRIPGTAISCTECSPTAAGAPNPAGQDATPPGGGVVNRGGVVGDVVNNGASAHASRLTDQIGRATAGRGHSSVANTGRIGNVQNNPN
ncbi:hypothetical protein E4198_00095 [Streptomyces sp. RKND-216]|uniref:hypothetical protein n=1 Tax=Streptomyces sp. RKND-216 TaxID=2562581 RepID=UPI00109D8FEE|nr:hypothetical protein [Streptomyces sp. RKND-216]THA28250.1 hypothetical protein E4198_00095 [Streptomyces sp. RKND-216]